MYSKQLFFSYTLLFQLELLNQYCIDENVMQMFSTRFPGNCSMTRFNARRTKIINGDFIAEAKWIHRILNPSIVQTWLANNLINWINNNWVSLYLFEPRITLFPLFLYFSSNFLFFPIFQFE